MEYPCTIKHIKGSSNSTADSLSRLPVVTPGRVSAPFPPVQDASGMALPPSITGTSKTPTVHKLEVASSDILYDVKHLSCNPSLDVTPFTINQIIGDSPVAAWDIIPLTVKEVAAATKTCKIYGKLFRAVKAGVLDTSDKDISKFNGVFESLYIDSDVIHLGNRIGIPSIFHDRLLTELHVSHIGVVSMKKVVRDIFWWPGITKSIEGIAARCDGCRKYKKSLPK